MSETYDVVVVGARCAGSPLATHLATAGFSVALLDKDEFPSDTPSTHFFQVEGILAQVADLRYEAEYVALERMTRITVRSRGEALVDTDGEHTGVLARAVAMDRTRLFAVADEFVGLRFVQRQMGAALQVFLGKA